MKIMFYLYYDSPNILLSQAINILNTIYLPISNMLMIDIILPALLLILSAQILMTLLFLFLFFSKSIYL